MSKRTINRTDGVTVVSARGAFRLLRALVASYLGLSVLTLLTVVVLRNDPVLVTAAVWIRCSIVAASAAAMMLFVVFAGRGSARAFFRLRLVSAIMVVAIIVIVVIPGDFPLWVKIEQGVCGVVLLGVVALVNGLELRSTFRSEG